MLLAFVKQSNATGDPTVPRTAPHDNYYPVQMTIVPSLVTLLYNRYHTIPIFIASECYVLHMIRRMFSSWIREKVNYVKNFGSSVVSSLFKQKSSITVQPVKNWSKITITTRESPVESCLSSISQAWSSWSGAACGLCLSHVISLSLGALFCGGDFSYLCFTSSLYHFFSSLNSI